MAWEDWIQSASNTVLGAYVQDRAAKRDAQTELAKLQLLGPGGYYTEGRAGAKAQPGGGLVLSPVMLLLAGGVLLVVLMRDD